MTRKCNKNHFASLTAVAQGLEIPLVIPSHVTPQLFAHVYLVQVPADPI